MRPIDIFDAYLNGKLNSADKAGFENQLRTDTVFANAFNEHKVLVESLIATANRAELKKQLKAIHEKDPIDLVFFGKQAIDGDTAQVGPGVAVRLDLPVVSYAIKIREVNLEQRYVIIERKTESRNEIIKAPLPAAMTCEKDIAEIPYASLPDLVYSLRYEPEVWTAESPIVFDIAQLGLKGSPTTVFKTGTPERHTAGEVFKVAEVGMDAVVKTALDKILEVEGMASMLGVKK